MLEASIGIEVLLLGVILLVRLHSSFEAGAGFVHEAVFEQFRDFAGLSEVSKRLLGNCWSLSLYCASLLPVPCLFGLARVRRVRICPVGLGNGWEIGCGRAQGKMESSPKGFWDLCSGL